MNLFSHDALSPDGTLTFGSLAGKHPIICRRDTSKWWSSCNGKRIGPRRGAIQGRTCVPSHEAAVWIRPGPLSRPGQERQSDVCGATFSMKIRWIFAVVARRFLRVFSYCRRAPATLTRSLFLVASLAASRSPISCKAHWTVSRLAGSALASFSAVPHTRVCAETRRATLFS